MKWLMTFLGAFVGGIVALIVTVVVAWFLFKWWLKRKFGNVMEQFESLAAMADTVPPFRLELEPGVNEEDWNEDLAEPLFQPLLDRGFVEAGAYHCEQSLTANFSLKGFASPEHGAWAEVFHHPQAGYWVELVRQHTDGTTLTFTTSKDSGMDHPDYSEVHHRTVETDELLDEFLAACTKPAKPVDPDQFAEVLLAGYARSMDWRIARGGVTREEIERQIDSMGEKDPDKREEMIAMIQSQWRSRINEFYDEQLRENFIKAAKMEPRKWEKIRDKLVFVHDKLTGEELYQRCEAVAQLWEDDENDGPAQGILGELSQLAHQGTPRSAFPEMAARMAGLRKVAKFGTIKRPVVSDVYGIMFESPQRIVRAIEDSDEAEEEIEGEEHQS